MILFYLFKNTSVQEQNHVFVLDDGYKNIRNYMT